MENNYLLNHRKELNQRFKMKSLSTQFNETVKKEERKMKSKKTLVGQIAFWKYDLFPFVLSNEVTEYDGHSIWLKGYDNSYFNKNTPFLFLPKEQGEKIQQKLRDLKNKRSEILEFLEKGFTKELDDILKEAKNEN